MALEHGPDIACFVRVAQLGSFSDVARKLGQTPSAVSKSVARLEARLGVKLVQRTARAIALTEAGTAYAQTCARLLHDLEEAEVAAAATGREVTGTLRMDMPLPFGRLVVMPLLLKFRAQYPAVKLALSLNDRIVDLIEENIDIATRVGNLPDSDLVAVKLCDQPLIMVASPSYLEWRGSPNTPGDLRNHNCIGFIRPQSGRQEPWRVRKHPHADEIDLVATAGDVSANSGEAVAQLAVAGLGIAQSPVHVVKGDLAAGRLTEVLPGYSGYAPPVWLVHRHGQRPPAKVRAMMDFLKTHIE